MEVLKLNNIVKAFPGVVALSDMSISLNAGEVHGVCGENGAGKSTLMKVITGVHKPDSGEIIVEGQKQDFNNPLEAFSKGISIIYQETSLFEEMTVLENVFLCQEIYKKAFGFLNVLDYKKMQERVDDIFKKLNVNISHDEKIKNLGMAQKQMVEIAKSLMFKSKILILDEPTASLTQREVDALFKIICRLKSEGVGILYISHRLEEIFELCDRVSVIRDGRFISLNNINDTNKDKLVSEMVGRSMDNYYPKADVAIGEEILRITNLSDSNVLKGVSLDIRKGEIVGLAGLAGSGRTELALALCGLAKCDCEKIVFEDKEIKINNYKESMNAGIVYVSEDRGKYSVVLDMSIKNNITMPQVDKLSKHGFIDDKVETSISEDFRGKMGIRAPSTEFLVANLSGGNQQKVSVSKALALNPKLLILDEPTRGVDVNAKAEIHKIISNMAQEGLTILMISSELPELLGMCDRIYVMKNGEIAGCFDRDEATAEKIVGVALKSDNDIEENVQVGKGATM